MCVCVFHFVWHKSWGRFLWITQYLPYLKQIYNADICRVAVSATSALRPTRLTLFYSESVVGVVFAVCGSTASVEAPLYGLSMLIEGFKKAI